jgi:hypothetical protein
VAVGWVDPAGTIFICNLWECTIRSTLERDASLVDELASIRWKVVRVVIGLVSFSAGLSHSHVVSSLRGMCAAIAHFVRTDQNYSLVGCSIARSISRSFLRLVRIDQLLPDAITHINSCGDNGYSLSTASDSCTAALGVPGESMAIQDSVR